MRTTFGPKTPLGKRRTTFAVAPEHDEAAIEEALVEREPITVVVSEKGWIRALRGQVADLSSLAFKADDGPNLAFFAETTSKLLVFATNGRCYTIEAAKLPGGRGHGEPVRLFIELEQEADIVSVFRYQGGRKLVVASKAGRGFVVPEDECLGNTRKGKQVLNVKPPDEARAIAPVEGELVAAIGENRKMVCFALDQVPEMGRGRGVRLQRYKDGGLSDITTFKADDGLTWIDSAGRSFNQSIKELAAWRGNRGDAGRVKPERFLTNLKFGRRVENGKENGKDAKRVVAVFLSLDPVLECRRNRRSEPCRGLLSHAARCWRNGGSAFYRASARASRLAEPAGAGHGAVSAGRRRRHHGAHHLRQTRRRSRPAIRHRKSRRRRRHHRRGRWSPRPIPTATRFCTMPRRSR